MCVQEVICGAIKAHVSGKDHWFCLSCIHCTLVFYSVNCVAVDLLCLCINCVTITYL